MSDELNIIQGERCRHLRSKGMYVNHGLPPGEEAVGDGYFWCLHTQTIFGPDEAFCGGEECIDSSRSCYESP
jgi:hypothetical protein